MKKLKTRIFLDDTSYIDFESSAFRYYDLDEKLENKDLNANERIALQFLCKNYNRSVNSSEIFEEVYGRPFVKSTDGRMMTVFMYNLRRKVKKGDFKYIESSSDCSFKLLIKHSPFENEELSTSYITHEGYYMIPCFKNYVPSIKDYLFSRTEELGNVSSMDFALSHLGNWLRTHIYILRKSIDCNVHLRIIFNIPPNRDVLQLMQLSSATSIEEFSDIKKSYFERWENAVNKLCEIKSSYPIEIRCAKMPIINDIYIVNGDNGNGWIKTKYSTYSTYLDCDPVLFFLKRDDEYQLYQHEFEYMWKLSEKNHGNDNNIYEYLTDYEKIVLRKIRKKIEDV